MSMTPEDVFMRREPDATMQISVETDEERELVAQALEYTDGQFLPEEHEHEMARYNRGGNAAHKHGCECWYCRRFPRRISAAGDTIGACGETVSEPNS